MRKEYTEYKRMANFIDDGFFSGLSWLGTHVTLHNMNLDTDGKQRPGHFSIPVTTSFSLCCLYSSFDKQYPAAESSVPAAVTCLSIS